MATLGEAILLAVQAHQGQQDKNGAPYILHPLRVMFRLHTEDEMMVGVLHDVVEDTDYTLEDLRERAYSEIVVENVAHVSRQADETYEQFIERIKPHPLAVRVKLADLADNMDIRRIATITKQDVERFQRYLVAYQNLGAAMGYDLPPYNRASFAGTPEELRVLEQAIVLAVNAHRAQTDYLGLPFILHPLRVMLRMSNPGEMTIAILHDVVEDTDITLTEMEAAGFSPTIITAVDALTRREEESYPDFIQRLKPNPLARRVKIADLEDNLDLRRLRKIEPDYVPELEIRRQAHAELMQT